MNEKSVHKFLFTPEEVANILYDYIEKYHSENLIYDVKDYNKSVGFYHEKVEVYLDRAIEEKL